MERLRLTPPGREGVRGERARLYVRWMPHLGAEAVALYELLRILPDIGHDEAETDELAELLRSTPESVEASLETLAAAGFITKRDGWLEVADHPPTAKPGKRPAAESEPSEDREEAGHEPEIEVIRAEAEGISADDYFKYMGTLPAPHIIEFLNGYSGRDGVEPDVVREALRISSERDARRVGYVRSILERWVERGVKTLADVERFEKDRKLRLVEQSGAVKGGALRIREGVRGGAHRQTASRREEDYKWFFGE